MTVYVVRLARDYVWGVFSTPEKADEAIRAHVPDWQRSDADVVAYELDGAPEEA